MSERTLEAMEAVEVLKEELIGKLWQVEGLVLTEICVEANVTIPPKKAKIKPALINLIVTHL